MADMLGQKLGIKVYDDELIAEAARKSGFSIDLFQDNDERKKVFGIGNIFSSNRFGSYTQSGINGSSLFQIQSDAIREIASRESAVFVGRASDYILRDMDCLDVFICAPMEHRKDRISERLKVSPEEAEKMILKRDRDRKSYYDFFTFGDNWGQAANYDLCLDSSIKGIEGTADFIIEFGEFL